MRRKKEPTFSKRTLFAVFHTIMLIILFYVVVLVIKVSKTLFNTEKKPDTALYLTKLSEIFITLMDICTIYVKVYWYK